MRDAVQFTVPPLSGFGFQSLTPADLDGPARSSGSPTYLMRHLDDEHALGQCGAGGDRRTHVSVRPLP